MRNYIIRKVLSRLLQKACPERIPRSGEDGQKINCFNIFIYENNKWNVVIQKVTKTHFEGIKWDGKHYSIDYSTTLNSIKMKNIKINHNSGLYDIYYDGFMNYMISGFTKFQILKVQFQKKWDKSRQYIYNKKKFATIDRIYLLRNLIDHYLKSNGEPIHIMDLMTELHTLRWILHPEKDKEELKLKLLLDSFIVSEDLQLTGNKYIITPKSIATLTNYEEAERKHKDNRYLKIVMIILTSILSLSSLVQITFILINNLCK